MHLKTSYSILYIILMISAFIVAILENPYLLAFYCTIILATVLDKSNYVDSDER